MRNFTHLSISVVAISLFLNIFSTISLSSALSLYEKQLLAFGTIKSSSVEIVTSFQEHWFDNVDRAVEVAGKFDVIITWCGYFVSDMHTVNPNLTILRYMPICGVYGPGGWGWNEALAGDWLLKDANGEYIHSTIWTTLYVCDPNNQGYRDWLANECIQEINQYGFDGIFGDGASATIRPMWDLSGDPINPDTGEVYTHHDWSMALVGLDQTIKQEIGSKLHIGNGCMQGSTEIGGWAHFEDYQQMLDVLDGAMIETSIFCYWGGFRSEEEWIEDVEFIKWHTSQDKTTLVWSVVGEEGEVLGEVESLTRYCFCSYLLGIQNFPRSPISTLETMETSYTKQLLSVELGTALEDYHIRNDNPHVYERDFSKAKVLVNPTYESYDISLDLNYTTLNGQIVSQVTLTPHTGMILLVIE